AHGLILNYYDPRIRQLEEQINSKEGAPKDRVPLRERLQKLRVERLYYLLVEDPRRGYEEYRRLSDQANRHRWVGYGMRLLDEFLRFYNYPTRRKLFQDRGISDQQIVRESAQMWVERFHWWGQYQRSIHLAEKILAQPELFSIRLCEEEDIAVLGNARALWARAKALLSGYDSEAVREAEKMWERLPRGGKEREALARARLATSIGYLYRLGGMLSEASRWYVKAQAEFRVLKAYRDELAQVLNNLAFAYARQGRVDLARPLAHEALQIDEELGNEYSTGLTLSTLSSIARMRGHYTQAIEYAKEALELFRELEDAHGVVLAHLGLAEAQRRKAKQDIEKNRKLEEARKELEKIAEDLEGALETARGAELKDAERRLRAEQGRLQRDLGHAVRVLEGAEKSMAHYTSSARLLRDALNLDGWNPVEKADAQQDLAETLFFSGDEVGAEECLEQIKRSLDEDIVTLSEKAAPQIPNEYYLPLAKVEMTHGQIAFMHGKEAEGLQRFLQAYVYFTLFSPDAVEKDALLEYLYKRMRDLTVVQQRDLMEKVRDRAFQSQLQDKFGVNVESFVRDLGDLLGA
ncbi:MAG TPA: tetratricopeptide repeat protein, partial [Chloroflexi bacterium]|nr:tetratricopeptide repeat protein [Chloroflexota bacterium]